MSSESSESSPIKQASTPLQAHILEIALAHPDATQGEIAEIGMATRDTVNRTLNDHYPQHASVRQGTKKDEILAYAEEHPKATRKEISEATGNASRYVGAVMTETDHPAAEADYKRTREDIRELLERRPPLSVKEISERCDVSYDAVRRAMISEDVHR